EIIARPDHSENDLSEKYNQAIRDLEISINFESIKQNFFDLILEINIEERTIISNMMDSPSFPKSLREFRSYLANWQRDIFLDIINLMFFGYENKQFPMKNYYQIVILNIMDVKKCFLGGKYYFCHPLNVNL